MKDISDDSLEFRLKLGTVGTDGDREDVIGEEDPSGMLHTTTAGVVYEAEVTRMVSEEQAAAIAQLSLIRKRLGQAMQEAKRLPDGMVSTLALGEMVDSILTACGWTEEARACLKKPLVEDEDVPTSTWED